MLYTTVASRNPRYYIEIGSGHSTKFVAKAIRDNNIRTKIISIDPAPRAEIDSLVYKAIRLPLEETNPAIFNELTKDDIVIIDGSHRAFPNSDVMVFFCEIIPKLPAGLLYAIHDIALPDEAFTDRYYNEQYMLSAYLLGGAAGDIIYFSPNYLGRETTLLDDLTISLDDGKNLNLKSLCGFFWLERGIRA